MKTLSSLLAGCLLIASGFFELARSAEPPPVELISDAPMLQPASTLEFRFARPMISRDEIGLDAKEPPITIEPPVAGRFTWLSRSSGVFVADSAWPLASEFAVSLRRGVNAADGKPLGGAFKTKLKTPPFTRTAVRGGAGKDGVSEPMPKVTMGFNLAVDLAQAKQLFEFVGGWGQKVAAEVRYGIHGDFISLTPEQEDWNERWQLAKQGPKPIPANDEAGTSDEPAEQPLQNRLVISPASALAPGVVWHLEMKRGLKSKSGRYEIADKVSVVIGKVEPFTLKTVRPESYVNSGRSVTLEFSHSIAPDITPGTAAKFFRFAPEVPKLRFEGWDTSLTARGDFELGREYKLIVGDDVISEEGLAFSGERKRAFRFAPVAPRLYLPEITGHQIRSGERKFEALSANLKSLHVIARVVAPADAAQAVEAFRKYDRQDQNGDENEMYQRLPEGLIRGRTIFDRVIDLPRDAIDARQRTALDWNEILGAQKAGVIFLTIDGEPLPGITGKRPGAQALIQLTDLGVLWKKTAEGLRVSVFSMADGTPVAASRVALLSTKFAGTSSGETDAQGMLTIPLAPEPGWLIVTHGDDTHALRLGPEGRELPMAAFNVPINYADWDAPAEKHLQLRALVFSDRPLYRPGETAHVKGIVREIGAAGLAVRAGLAGVLKLTDPRGREVSETDVKIDDRGGFDTEIALSAAATGAYTVRLVIPDAPGTEWQRGFRCKFEVADFQPNAFELDLALPSRLAPGTNAAAKLTAKYFFGAPLTKADARWTLRYMRTQFEPEGFATWRFGDEDAPESKILTLRGQGALAGADGFSIQPQLPAVKDMPHRGVLTVEVTDMNQQTVSESRLFTRDAADFYLGLAVPEGVVFRPGDEMAVRAIAVRPDGQPVPQPAEISAELIEIHRDTVRVQGAGKAVSFRTETSEQVVEKAAGSTLIPSHEDEGWIVRNGASVTFKAPHAGQYRIHVKAKDATGREVASVLPVFVSGREEVAWDYRNPAQLDMIADKPEYRPGETARLLVKSPISGDALVTIEREESILRTMRVKLEGNAPTIEIPLEKADAPNVFVSVVLIRGREQSTRKFKTPEYRYGVSMLRVSDPREHLQVEIAPARAEVQPGDEVDTEVRVRDGAGAPVADAEVTFFAVDDGILALTGYERPAPGSIFGASLPLNVRTGLTLFELLPEDPGDLEFSNKGYLIGGGGIEGPGLKLRRDFPGTACWFPSLRTDATGNVRVRFRAPDALTRYRLVAVVSAGARLFGSGESAFAIRKALMLMPALGQFANVADELIARAVVRNESGVDGTVEVALALDPRAEAVKPGDDATRAKLDLRNGEARAVDFPVRLRATGSAEWKWSARMEAGGRITEDHVVSTLAVGSPAPVLRETYLAEPARETNDLLAGVNPQLLEGAGTVAVTIANTRLATLGESANRVLEYPYGCAEQTTSTLIPWALLPVLRPVMPDLAKDEAGAHAAIAKSLDRLFGMQTPGGGIAYWPGGREPSFFASAYAALACSLLAKQNIELPAGHDALLKYLSEELRGSPRARDEQELADRVLALYALAASGQPEPAYHEALFRRRSELSRESRALLALAVMDAGGPASMRDALLDPRAPAVESDSWFGGAARERAIQLLAWSRHKPHAEEVGRLTKELLGYRVNGHWGTTQSNAWALLALAHYYTAAERGVQPVDGAFVSRGLDVPFHLTVEKRSAIQSFAFTPAEPLGGVSIRNPDKGELFSEARFVVRPPAAKQPRQDRGYAVSRTYRKLADDGSMQDAGDLKVGDRIVVTLRVETTRPGHFVAIDDPLPAILEAVNPAFRSREAGGVREQDWVSDYREMRADRVLYFCDHLPVGAFTFRYLARVRSAGAVTAGPTKVEEMYRPERFGLGESTQLVSHLAEMK